MQYKIPQDVQREDTLVGPLTLRQLIICGVGFAICYGLWTSLGRDYGTVIAAVPTIFVAMITIVFSFIKPLDLFFEKFLIYWAMFTVILPRKRYWLKGTADPSRYEAIVTTTKKKTSTIKTDETAIKPKKSIKDLSKILDTK